MKKLNQIPSKLNYRHKKLADQLVAMHHSESPYAWKPIYTYEKLKKGIICPICFSFMLSVGDKMLVCEKCGCEEKVDTAVLRSVKELKFLFPNKKITTSGIHEWCGVIGSTKVVRRILFENFSVKGYGRWFYFE
jgi:hypothetical protein